MSVDTYLKGKNLTRYAHLDHDGLEVHIAPSLRVWADRVWVDAERAFLFWKRFLIDVEHRHQPT